MTQNAALRLVLQHMNDTGEEAAQTLDTDGFATGIPLSGYTDFSVRRIKLAVDADDQAVEFTAAIGVVVVSRDYAFSLRKADGETLFENLRLFVLWAADEDTEACTTSVLLTGNGDNVAAIEVWIFEKP